MTTHDGVVAPLPAPKGTTALITGLMLAVFLGMLDQQIVATALPQIVGDLGGLSLFGWVTTTYILASSITVPIYGKLGDQFGRKGIFMAAIALFLVGSLASALAPSIALLIVSRGVQGLGAGGLFVSVFAIIGETFGPRGGAKYFGYFSIAFTAAAVAGPFVGGVMTDLLGWRSVFFLNLPFGLVALFMVGKFLNLPVAARRARIDVAGILLLSGAIIAITLATSWGGVTYAWSSPIVLGLIALTVVSLVAFVFVERRAAEPVMPLHLFRDRTFTVCVLLCLIAGAVFLGSVNFLALFVQVVTDSSPTVSGLVLLPMMLGLVVSSQVSSRLIQRTGKYRWHPVASMGLGAVASLLLSTMDSSTPRLVALLYMALFGVAAGLNISVLTLAAQNTTPREDIGAVSATVTFGRSIGTSLGISVFAGIFLARLSGELARRLPAGTLAGVDINSLSSAAVLRGLPTAVLQDVRMSYADSLTSVFFAAVPLLVVGVLLSLLLRDVPMQGRGEAAATEQDAQDSAHR